MIEPVAPRFQTAAARIARAWLAAMNAHDAEALRTLLAEDFTWMDAAPSAAATPSSRPGCASASAAEAVDLWQQWFAAMPDLACELVGEFDGDSWAIRQVRFRGSRHRPAGVAPPGAGLDTPGLVDQPGCAIFRVRADRIAQLWIYRDASEPRGSRLPRPHADF